MRFLWPRPKPKDSDAYDCNQLGSVHVPGCSTLYSLLFEHNQHKCLPVNIKQISMGLLECASLKNRYC